MEPSKTPAPPERPGAPRPGPSAEETDRRLRALAHGVEFAKRCFEAASSSDLHLLLTNDISALLEFDRAFLVVHLGGETELVAASNTPILEEKTRFHEEALELGRRLVDLSRGVLIPSKIDPASAAQYGLPEDTMRALRTYIEFSKCTHLFVMPLSRGTRPTAHLMIEFFAGRVPDETRMVALLSLASVLAEALAMKWLSEHQPSIARILDPAAPTPLLITRRRRIVALTAALLAAGGWLLFGIPFPLMVGGEAEITPVVRTMAFSKMSGLIAHVFVSEGAVVREGQTLATLDPRELDHRIESARRQVEIYASDAAFLQRSAAQGQVAKLAERDLVELKLRQAQAELTYDQWQQQFIAIKAPATGTVVTRDVESLAGKKLLGGEAFCEIQAAGGLAADVMVAQDRISLVREHQPMTLYLDSRPREGYALSVTEIEPRAEALPRLGNIFRVRAAFPDAPPRVMAGMKGIGRITIGTTRLWSLIRDRAVRLWRRCALLFS